MSKNTHIAIGVVLLIALVVVIALLTRSYDRSHPTPSNPADQPSTQTPGNPDQSVGITPKASDLNGTSYELTSFNGNLIPPSEHYSLSFENGKLNAKFCNSMGGDYAINNGMISANLMSTMMACTTPEDSMAIETQFGSIIGSGASIKLDGTSLTIMAPNGKVMIFGRTAQ